MSRGPEVLVALDAEAALAAFYARVRGQLFDDDKRAIEHALEVVRRYTRD